MQGASHGAVEEGDRWKCGGDLPLSVPNSSLNSREEAVNQTNADGHNSDQQNHSTDGEGGSQNVAARL